VNPVIKPKLLVYTSTFPRWKGDTDPPFVYELARRLTSEFEVHVLTPYYPNAKRKEIVDKINVVRFRYFIGKYQKLAGETGILPTLKKYKIYYFVLPFFVLFSFFYLLKQIRQVKPDVIHAHWLLPQGFLTALASRFYSVPFIVTLHGADIFALKNFAFRWMKNFTLRRAAKITVVSSAILKEISSDKLYESKISVLPMGVDSQKFFITRKFKDNKQPIVLKILYVGRLSEKKGVQYLLEALAILKKEKLAYQATIVGHGELEKQLKNKALKLGLISEVSFLGGVHNDELPAIYAEHDVFVGASIQTKSGDTEGLGLTFVEAGMAGCLLIGSKVGGIEDIIQHLKTGFLVEERNPQSIAKTIQYITKNYDSNKCIREEGQLRCCQKYDWKSVARKYKEVLLSVCRSC